MRKVYIMKALCKSEREGRFLAERLLSTLLFYNDDCRLYDKKPCLIRGLLSVVPTEHLKILDNRYEVPS